MPCLSCPRNIPGLGLDCVGLGIELGGSTSISETALNQFTEQSFIEQSVFKQHSVCTTVKVASLYSIGKGSHIR